MADVLVISDFEFPYPCEKTHDAITKTKENGTKYYDLSIGEHIKREEKFMSLLYMKKNLLILVCLATLLSCTNKGENCKKESNNEIECTESKLSPESEQAGNIPSANNAMTHIFHGWTESIAKAHLNEEGDVTGWSKWEPLVVKYALYLDEGIIAIYDDSTQLHQIEEYLGKEIRSDEGAVSYNIMVNDYGDFGGYIRFYYQDDGMVQLYVDYPEMMISYSLESFMPEEELERRLGKYSTQK